MLGKQTVEAADVAGKRVLIRVDFNVPLANGAVADDTRIRSALPTIRYLLDEGAKVIVMSHLGRPRGEPDPALSLRPVAARLAELTGATVTLVDETVGDSAVDAARHMAIGDIVVLENTRFQPGEKANDPAFSRELAALADVYVDDAFGAAHRAHASTVGVAEILPAYAGLLMAREVETLSGLLTDPARPFVAILGGSKVSDKLGVIDRLIDVADTLLIGGGMAFTFLVAMGVDVGESIVEEEWVERASTMLAKAERVGTKILLPVDFVVAESIDEDAATQVVARDAIPGGMMGLDVGPQTIVLFEAEIAGARTIFWNGPMGVFEVTPFVTGTHDVALAIAENESAVSVIGGGDSVAALRRFGLEDRVTFASTGGGASMKLVEGERLPGVEVLLDA
jgi:phosphoglycerate kinase